MLLFVYGSLKSQNTASQFLSGAKYMGPYTTPAHYTMHTIEQGQDTYPAVVVGGATAIVGEVYEITPEHLQACDEWEDYPALYDRFTINTTFGTAMIYIYVQDVANLPIIDNGCWT